MNQGEIFLESVIKRFMDYKELCEKAFSQLDDAGFYFMPSKESNNIAIIIQHMHGNMMSRWTDFLTTDGEKEWRQRDNEFEDQQLTRGDLLNLWNMGWTCCLSALRSLGEHDLLKTIFIRDQPLSVTDAINRQFAHYSYHIGQIIYIARIIKDKDWKSLSIPKGQSGPYNQKRLS